MTKILNEKYMRTDKMTPSKNSNLKTRIISAALLVPVVLFLAYYNLFTFLVLIGIFILALSWEWGRITRNNGWDLGAALTALTSLTVMGALVWKDLNLVWAVLGLGILAVYFLTLKKRRWAVLGLLYIVLPSCALVWLRSGDAYGFLAIAFVLLVVWTTDSASYAIGRMIGGVKFAPDISPNKTWAGFLGGIWCAAMVGALFALGLGNSSPKTLGIVAFLIAVSSQYGDLLESAVKRHFGIKDSSQLIPGHGGAFDRLDGLLLASVMAACIALFKDGTVPGQSLLIW